MRHYLSIAALLAIFVSPMAYAKDIALYQKPDAKSKIVAKVADPADVVIIFQPKKGDWLKIGDMTNGNVGWIKLDALDDTSPAAEAHKPTSSLPYHKKIVKRSRDDLGGQHVQVFEYQGSENLSQEQVQDMMQRMEQRQRTMQHSLNRMMRSMMIDFDQFGLNEEGIDDPIFDTPEQATQKEATQKTQPTKTSWWQSIKSKIHKTA